MDDACGTERTALLRAGSKRTATAELGNQREFYLLSMFEGLKSPVRDNVHRCISELRPQAGKKSLETEATC